MRKRHTPTSGRDLASRQNNHKSPYRYPGGKAKLWPALRPLLKQSLTRATTFVEPFIGGGATLINVAKEWQGIHLVAADANPFIAAYWQTLSSSAADVERLCHRILDCIPTVELWSFNREAMSHPQGMSVVEMGFRGLLDNRLSRGGFQIGGMMGGKSQANGKIDQRWRAAQLVQRTQAIHRLLAGRLTAVHADALEVIAQNPNAVKYIDPPYPDVGVKLYSHSFAAGHKPLADLLKWQSDWVLSYPDCVEIRDQYKFARIDTVPLSYCGHREEGKCVTVRELLIRAVFDS